MKYSTVKWLEATLREMENISRGPTFGDLVTILTEGSMLDVKVARLYRVQEYRLPSPPCIKCNVLHESLSEDSQNIPCATLKRRGSWTLDRWRAIFIICCQNDSIFNILLGSVLYLTLCLCGANRDQIKELKTGC